jgi:hypothetical protein
MRYLLFFSTLIFIVSCSKSVESRLEGRWEYLGNENFIQTSVFVNDTVLTEVRATITFIEGGTGTFKVDGEKSDLTWSATDKEVSLAIKGKDTLKYSVVTNEKDVQKWSYTKEDCSVENAMSYCYKWDYQLELIKLD